MNWAEILQKVSDQARSTFPAVVTTVDAITPIELMRQVTATAADFDFLSPVAQHIYYIDSIAVVRTLAFTGPPEIIGYDLTPAAQTLMSPAFTADSWIPRNFFVTRLAHLKNGATAGEYSIIYSGFDIEYTT